MNKIIIDSKKGAVYRLTITVMETPRQTTERLQTAVTFSDSLWFGL